MQQRKSIYVLSTGGTISMQKSAQGLVPSPKHLEQCMQKLPELQNPDMPLYTLEEYERPLDSANMTPEHWLEIGQKIVANYAKYDGFVILHGTDSMAYTASALSFILENLAKPVILTGAQLPLFVTRSDARENLINAMLFAGYSTIPEVCIYFNNKLLRGNRAKKIDASSFTAFASPNFPTLGKVGTEVSVRKSLMRSMPKQALHLQTLNQVNMIALRIFPGMSLSVLEKIIAEPIEVLLLETYGLGTAPENPAFLHLIQRAIKQGIVIVNCSQCPTAKVRMGVYSSGSALSAAGVISAGDMTAEASLTKLFYLFSKKLTIAEIKTQFTHDLRGELTL